VSNPKKYKRGDAITRDALISPEYLAEQVRLHAEPRGYGGRGDKWADVVAALIQAVHTHKEIAAIGERSQDEPLTVLDYGCGQGKLGPAVMGKFLDSPLIVAWANLDHARPEFRRMPDPADLVVCTDVLEHIEPEKIMAVLDHLRALTRVELFTVISLVPTEKKLSDGRQAHILLKPESWWRMAMEAAGFEPRGSDFPNPKPEKQFVQAWRPI
jgi:hypothetical protein